MAKKPDAPLPNGAALSALRPKRKPGGKPFGTAQPVPRGVPFTKDDPRRFAGDRRAHAEYRKLCEAEALGSVANVGLRLRAGRITTAQVQAFRAVSEHAGFPPVTRVEVTGRGGGPIRTEKVLDVSDLTAEELELAIRLHDKAKARDEDKDGEDE